jgi:hypothetical protein
MSTDTGVPTVTPFFDHVTTCEAVPVDELVLRVAPFAPAGAVTVLINFPLVPAEFIWNSLKLLMCVLPNVSNVTAIGRAPFGPNGTGGERSRTLSGGKSM